MDSSAWQYLSMSPVTKSYLSSGLVFLSIIEFLMIMQLFGKKGPHAKARLLMRLHRIFGYVFGAYFIWISWVCIDMMGRLARAGGYELDARGFGHAFFAMLLFGIFLLKVSLARVYHNYRAYVPLLGIMLAVGTIVLWGVAGWMFLVLVGGAQTVTPGASVL